jgi:quercetin dioxygenase-like cupin family protein
MAARKRGVRIFKGSEATHKQEFTQLTEEQLAPLLMVSEVLGAGLVSRDLLDEKGGFALKHLWLKPNFPLPRHDHSPGECLYYVISGNARMGNQVIRAGDSFLVPAGAPYHYTAGADGVEVLEIRYAVDHIDMNVLEDPEAYKKRAFAALEANREVWEKATTAPTFAD